MSKIKHVAINYLYLAMLGVFIVGLPLLVWCDILFFSGEMLLFSNSDYVLLLTALIIVWYTYETSITAKAAIEEQHRISAPTVSNKVFLNENDFLDTRFALLNTSKYPVAVLIKLNLKINGEDAINVPGAYNGKDYWNLPLNSGSEGHFNWLSYLPWEIMQIAKRDLEKSIKNNKSRSSRIVYLKSMLDESDINKEIYEMHISFIRDLMKLFKGDTPKVEMDVEIYSQNEKGDCFFPPPKHYQLDFLRRTWIPTLESDRPFWDYDRVPEWVEE